MLHKPGNIPYCYVEINTPDGMMSGIIPQLIVDEVFFPFTWDSELGRDAGVIRVIELDDGFDIIEFNSGEISHYLQAHKIPRNIRDWALEVIKFAGCSKPVLDGNVRYHGVKS